IGTWYMLSEMLAFFKVLLKYEKKAVFLFITRESEKLILQEASNQNIPHDSIRIVSANREQVPSYIHLFDWSIFFIKPLFSKQASSPTKQGELMSMNIPIICNSNIGDTDYIVKTYESGLLLENFSDSSFEELIRKMTSGQGISEELREDARLFFGLENGIKKYAAVYEHCLS
ncbi:MAG: hypothetical protein AAF789_05755, partial [Bacteroidota bacterium]